MKTIQYMGSKKELLEFIEESIEHFLVDIKSEDKITSFLDAFCGSGRVAYHFKDKYNVATNDKQEFTKTITDAYLCNTRDASFYEPFIKELNDIQDTYVDATDYRSFADDKMNITEENLELAKKELASKKELEEKPNEYFEKSGKWFTTNYGCDFNGFVTEKGKLQGISVGEDGNPKVWRTSNSRKIDMIRHRIEELYNDPNNEIGETEKNVLLLSLILGINKISNVVGHQNGYLKKWSQGALKDLNLLVPEVENWTNKEKKHNNYVGDIFPALEQLKADIVYFDPPYGTNNKNLVVATRYSSFYHLWNTIVKNNRPELFGKAGKPTDTKGYTAPLEKNLKNIVMPKMVRLIEESNGKYVAFSYSNKSLLTAHDFKEVYRIAGCDMSTYRLYVMEHKSNNQNKLAKKEGEYINRANNDDRLIEYFFIAKKDENHVRVTKPYAKLGDHEKDVEEKLEAVDAWLSGEGCDENEDYNLPEDNASIREYIKEYIDESLNVHKNQSKIITQSEYKEQEERRFEIERRKMEE
jgi:adenine-specific DNA-methyltransferase